MWLGDSQSEASIRWHWPIRGLLRRLWISRVRCRRSKVGELLKQNMIWVDRSDINEVRIWHRSLSRYCDPWITPGMLFMGRLRWPLKNKDKNKTRDFQNILFSPSNFFTHLFSSINPEPARLFSPPSPHQGVYICTAPGHCTPDLLRPVSVLSRLWAREDTSEVTNSM